MATALKSFDFMRGKYPWDEWSDGRPWRIRQGQDFDVSISAMRSVLYQRAARFDLSVKVSKTADCELTFQFSS